MPRPVRPIYQKGATRFQIDSNAPLLAAVRGRKIEFHALSHGNYPGERLRKAQIGGLSSVGFWNGAGRQDWGLELHRNEGVEICFLETGTMDFSLEAKNFELHSGNFTITRPWQIHKLGGPNIGPGRLHWVILDVGVRRPNQEWRWPRWMTLTEADQTLLTRKLRYNENAVWTASPALATAFRGLSDCVLHWKKPFSESRMITLLNQLLLEILGILTQVPSSEDLELISRRHTVKLFLRDLAKNRVNCREPWTLGKMSAHCGMGITAFSKYCRQLANNGPVEYLNQCRLDHAAQQLRDEPSVPIIEVAFDNGFNSSQYFATLFRHRFRLSPRQYRERELRQGA